METTPFGATAQNPKIAGAFIEHDTGSFTREESVVLSGEVIPHEDFALWRRINARLEKLHVEARGMQRVPENERNDTSTSNSATIWLSSNMTVSAFAIGALAIPVFGLEFVDATLTIVLINILGVIPVAFYSTLGPSFGLRQMALGRYWFGYHPVKIFAILNTIAAICWSSVNTIVGAQLFRAVNNDIPSWAAVIIIAAGCGIISFFGYRVVHLYQKWSWIPGFIILLVVLGEFAHSGQFRNLKMRAGSSEAGSILSFAAAVFGNSTGWSTFAADYTVYMPRKTSRVKIFTLTFLGLVFPLLFTQILGAAVATTTTDDAAFASAYDDAGIGGLLEQVLRPLGTFGRFCLIVLALGIIASNCPNQYSISLNLQLLSSRAQHVPRFWWTALSVVAFAALAIGGYGHFESFLKNFMLVMAYWVSIYESISLIEHVGFRKGVKGYDAESWAIPGSLPLGIAASLAACFGVMGAVLGMAQVWFGGPIGKLVSGDIGFELSFAFSAVVYIPCRVLERNHFGR